MSKVQDFFGAYAGSRNKFSLFHREVINMPRDSFSNASLKKLQSLASYLLLIKDKIHPEGSNYKEFLRLMINEYEKGNTQKMFHRNIDFENTYFQYEGSFDEHYTKLGRRFRHSPELANFFGLIDSISKHNKIVNTENCKKLSLSSENILMPVLRNDLIFMNIRENQYLKLLDGIHSISTEADYKPAHSIMRYLSEIKRPATDFELAILFGRIDAIQKEGEIYGRAKQIGHELTGKNKDQQIEYFFKELGWHTDGIIWNYAASQQPEFKFKSFFKYMEVFELIKFNSFNKTYTLTDYATKLLEEEIAPDLIDLESLLYKIDDDTENDATLANLIINKRTSRISSEMRDNPKLIERLNKRSIRNTQYDSKGKRKRNRLIIEIAKMRADYTCEVTGQKVFKLPNGTHYVEAHHIIEFSTENGPDITENLLIISPNIHRLIHLACQEEKDDLHTQLMSTGKISFDRFKSMQETYSCLTEDHVEIIHNKRFISSNQKNELLALIQSS